LRSSWPSFLGKTMGMGKQENLMKIDFLFLNLWDAQLDHRYIYWDLCSLHFTNAKEETIVKLKSLLVLSCTSSKAFHHQSELNSPTPYCQDDDHKQ
jgi:hypothetical protein